MKSLLFTFFVSCILLFQTAYALQLQDGLFFTMPPDEIECIDIVLPDNMGVFGMGKIEYELTSTASSDWADLTEENIVRTDENNTVIFPMCFYSFGRQEGECSEPYVITIEAPALQLTKHWSGGACVSEFVDVDIGEGNDSWDVINDNVDLFDIGFEEGVIYSEPGEIVNYELSLQSYANITLDLVAQSMDLIISPMQRVVTFSSSDPQRTATFAVSAPVQTGRYNFTIRARMRDCGSMDLCTKYVQAELVVTDEIPDNAGFTVSLFPNNINIRDLYPVLYRFTIQNGDTPRTFTTDITLPSGLSSTFEPETINLVANEKKIISFTITPSSASAFYEIRVTATSEGNMKQATSYLSTNEMLTDAIREAGSIETDQENVNNELDEWIERYRRSGYGENMDDYQRLKGTFSDAKQGQGGQINGDNGDETGDGGILDNIWIIVLVVVIVVAALIFLMYKKSGKSVLEREI